MTLRKEALAVSTPLFVQGAAASETTSQMSSLTEPTLLVALIVPFVAAGTIALFYERLGNKSALLSAFSALISFSAIFSFIGSTTRISYPWIPSMNIFAEFYIDGLSIFFGLLASGIGVLVFLYSWKYMDHGERKRKYYTALTAFMGSMLGLVFSSDLILMFLFWELTSICSFILISHRQRMRSGIIASKKSFFITVGSGLAMLVGFILLGNVAGTFSVAEILSQPDTLSSLESAGLTTAVVALIGIGAVAKSAQVPFHIWLPDAMEAPTPVSSFLHSATMVKAGIFLLLRFRPIFAEVFAWNLMLVSLGITTMFVAAVLAFASTELKQLLAYSTASHLGLIVAGIGFSSNLGVETALFHVLNHAVFKAGLFMVAGIILHEAGTQKFSELSGLRHRWPVLTVVGTICAMSMAGIPPFNGFYSKELLFEAAYYTASTAGGITWILPAMSVIGSAFTFMYSLKFVSVFYGYSETSFDRIKSRMMFSPAILALTTLAITAAPNQFIDLLVNPALELAAKDAHALSVHMPHKLKPAFAMSLVTIGLGSFGMGVMRAAGSTSKRFTSRDLIRPNFYYFGLLDALDRSSDLLINYVESGLLRTYVIWVIVFSSFTGITGYFLSGFPVFSLNSSLPIAIVLSVSLVSVYSVLKSESYISSVMVLSILGFMVSIFYLLMDAPDLVLTQLVVETMSLIVFLLVLNKLPSFDKSISFNRKSRDIIISIFAGVLVSLSVVYATMEETPSRVSEYFVENAVPGSGGGNVVNVILVDFRGLDTLGEISVIAMASIAVLMLFKMRGVKT